MAKELSFSEKAKICQESFSDTYYHVYDNQLLDEEDYEDLEVDRLLAFSIEILRGLNYSSIKIVRDIKKSNCLLQVTIAKELTTKYSMFDFYNVQFCMNFDGKWMTRLGKKELKETSLEKNFFTLYIPYMERSDEIFSFACKPKNYYLAIE